MKARCYASLTDHCFENDYKRNQSATAIMSGLYIINTKATARGKTPAMPIHHRILMVRISSVGSVCSSGWTLEISRSIGMLNTRKFF